MCHSDTTEEAERSKQIDLELKRDSFRIKNTIRVLLLGPGESGKSTFLKQMQVLHKDGFCDEDKQKAIEIVYDNVHESIYALVTNLRKHNGQFELQLTMQSAAFILSYGPKRPRIIPHKYPAHVKLIWTDAGIQRLFAERESFQLLDCAKYFLDKIDQIYSKSYVPSTDDILHARTVTQGVHEMNFSVKKGKHAYEILMVDVGGQREQRSSWIKVFDGVKVILYLSACSEFDQTMRESETENRLKDSIKLFAAMWRSRPLRDAGFIVFLNKTDMLEEKLRNGKRMSHYFEDFCHFLITYKKTQNSKSTDDHKDDPHNIEVTKKYIKHKFKQIAVPFTLKGFIKDEEILVQRECTLHFTTATNTKNIKKVFSDCEHIILTQNLKKFESS